MATDEIQSNLLPHHEQLELCTTRLPYRQGRKLTAVKVYTVNNESKHLLIFNVPALNLRQETKALFMKFGKLLQFNITKHPSEQFTETYHAIYESIQSARIAKKMLDTKNYYGGNIHICYAPEFESIQDTREKLSLRKTQVRSRVRNLQRDEKNTNQEFDNKIEEQLKDLTGQRSDDVSEPVGKVYMGDKNKIFIGKRKQKAVKTKMDKKLKMADKNKAEMSTELLPSSNTESSFTNVAGSSKIDEPKCIEIIDFTSPNTEVMSNINDALNYNNFGNEIIKSVPQKPLNKIKFNINKK